MPLVHVSKFKYYYNSNKLMNLVSWVVVFGSDTLVHIDYDEYWARLWSLNLVASVNNSIYLEQEGHKVRIMEVLV